MRIVPTAGWVVVLAVVATGAFAQTEPPAPPPAPDSPAAENGASRPGADAPGVLKPYERVITREAISDPGVFLVHRIGEKLFYEIPRALLGREFLWVAQLARTTVGGGFGGQPVGNRVVKWERRGDRVLLRSVSYAVVADPASPVSKSVAAANYDAILMSFPVQTQGKDGGPVIEVTRLFTSDVPEFSGRQSLRARAFDASRSFVERAVAYPENIEVEATQTYNTPPDAPVGGGRVGSASVLMHYSMVLLPATPMRPRLFDDRVGYFNLEQFDYSRDDQRAPRRRYVTRWRLEKQQPGTAPSEPVKPIVFYIDPATPAKWVPYLKRGIEAWQPAFEAAGFTRAIQARDAPTAAEDPDWSPEDARYSVVRWLPTTVENASGPHVHDPRSGEILEADIQFHHNVMKLVRDWYVVQVGPLDPRLRRLPMPDDLMGQLLQMVMTHEVGHTLGLQHNMKASSLYPAASLRDRAFVKRMGHTPSIMDYARFNYVAQPEDGIDTADLIPRIGPYDTWAIRWAYTPIADVTDADGEKPTLDRWAREQDTTPWLRFSTAQARGSDPGELTEAVGDEDAVASTRAGIRNLARVADLLLTAVGAPGDTYADLEELFGRLVGQWSLEMGHVVALVGGVASQQKHVGQAGALFTPVPRERQAAAVRFLSEQAFRTPAFLVRPDILRRIEPAGALARVRLAQQRILDALLAPARLTRLVEQETIDPAGAYRPLVFLEDVRRGVWSEVYGAGTITVDAYRRNLQRAWVETLGERVAAARGATDDARAFFGGELRTLDAVLRTARVRAADPATRRHLDDVRHQIARALDPAGRAGVPGPAVRALRSGLDEDAPGAGGEPAEGCWTDYALRP